LGRTIFESGNIHEGEYVDDKREGWGRFIWSDGAYYDGNWSNGMRNGQGKFVHASGEIEEGVWKEGELITAGADDSTVTPQGTDRLLEQFNSISPLDDNLQESYNPNNRQG